MFTDAESVFSLSKSDPVVNEQASHMYDAMNQPYLTFPSWVGKTVPGQWSPPPGTSEEDTREPLHRLWDETASEKNRSEAIKVCKNVWGADYAQPDGKLNCDEYPFATTYEGSNNGNKRFSARVIDGADNQAAGGRLKIFYHKNRILDGDPFFVRVTE